MSRAIELYGLRFEIARFSMSQLKDQFIHIGPADVQGLVNKGALLIDIREPDELEEVAPGAQFLPMSILNAGLKPQFQENDTIIYYCRSGRRTRINAEKLYEVAQPAKTLYIVDGGIFAWKEHGLPLVQHNVKVHSIEHRVAVAV